MDGDTIGVYSNEASHEWMDGDTIGVYSNEASLDMSGWTVIQ